MVPVLPVSPVVPESQAEFSYVCSSQDTREWLWGRGRLVDRMLTCSTLEACLACQAHSTCRGMHMSNHMQSLKREVLSGKSKSSSPMVPMLPVCPVAPTKPCIHQDLIHLKDAHFNEWLSNSCPIEKALIYKSSPIVPLRAFCPVSPVAPARACICHDTQYHGSSAS